MTSLAKSLAKSGVTKHENPANDTPESYMFMLHKSYRVTQLNKKFNLHVRTHLYVWSSLNADNFFYSFKTQFFQNIFKHSLFSKYFSLMFRSITYPLLWQCKLFHLENKLSFVARYNVV